MWGGLWLDGLARDTRYALRTLARTPAFTVAAVLTLGLGIGANTAIFSLVETVLLRTVPVRAPEQLVFLAYDTGAEISTGSNYPYFERVSVHTDVFEGVAAYDTETFKVALGESVGMTSGQYVSGNYHAVLGVPMALGRGFSAEDERAGTDGLLAVISHAYWTEKFGGDPDVLARTLVVQGRPVSIVGVTAPGFHGLQPASRADVTLPMSVRALDEPTFFTEHDSITSMPIVARLKSDVTQAQALGVVESVLRQYLEEPAAEFWRSARQQPGSVTFLPAARGEGFLREQYGGALTVLMALVGVVLVIGCANVATLVMARASARMKDMAVRLAVGARRGRIVRQLFTESLLLAGIGGALGFLLAWWGAGLISAAFAVGERPLLIDVQPNLAVLVFTSAVSLVTVIMFGVFPAFSTTRVDVTRALKESGTSSAERRKRWSGRQSLVVMQIALSLVLLVGAGLLVRSFWNLATLDVGFDRTNVAMFSVDVEATSVAPTQLPQLCDVLLERLRARPGASSASCSVSVPVRGTGSTRALTVVGLPASEQRDAFANQVTSEYFRTFGVTLVRGRLLAESDAASSAKVAVVNERFARDYFGDADSIGRTLRFGIRELGDPITIVGVVGDTLQGNTLREPARRIVYTPLEQQYTLGPRVTVGVRTTEPMGVFAAAARQEVRAVSDEAVVDYVRTMEQQIDASLSRERVLSALSLWFGALALALACVGLYGVVAYDVGRRRREIGIRLALGAQPAALMRDVLVRAGLLVGAGVAAGLAGAFAASRFLGSLLYGLGPADPVALGAGGAVLAITALAASYLPARRASRISPAVVLRAE